MDSKRDSRRPAVPADREALRRQVRHPYITRQSPQGGQTAGGAPPDAATEGPAACGGATDGATDGADGAADEADAPRGLAETDGHASGAATG